ncbi:zinc-dependent alcohol dehydrogenase [Streptomyces cadmiisoli]|uniref:Dehydrogenase n=1 Tax=Streptomyces cadmiisoli TaxID=2184053 RepID=A0A2Z4ITD9_9ACTN|nr:zinc-binding dehydrogenase [Streptomyces cadmiisoli]AWW36000.1 dehydrogenase [Streptomyces cadmiisoli]
MRAVVVHPGMDVRVERVPDPGPCEDHGAVVAVRLAGICGSDLRTLRTGRTAHRPGHEFVGDVVAVGAGVGRWRPGSRVFGSALVGCGRCAHCRASDPLRCHDGSRVLGEGPDLPGAQADYVYVPAADRSLHAQGTFSDATALLLTDALPTGWAGAERLDVGPADDVLVVGLGPVGLCAVAVCSMRGARRIFVADPDGERRRSAERLGAEPLDPLLPVPEQIREHTGGGAHCVFDAVGDRESVAEAIRSAAVGGRVALLGMAVAADTPVPLRRVGAYGLTLHGVICAPSAIWPGLVPEVTAGRFDLDRIVAAPRPLRDARHAYDDALAAIGGAKFPLRP